MNLYVTILLQFVLISSCILFLFKFREKLGLAPLYILLGSVQYVQALSGALISFKLFETITVYPASVIMFSAVLFAVLLIYIKEGAASARTLIIGVIISNLILSALFSIIYAQETLSLGINAQHSSVFEVNYKYFLTGTSILLVDFILLVILYQFLVSKISRLYFFLTLFISLFSVLVFDAFAFNIALKINSDDFATSLYGHVFGKSIAAFIFSVILYVYLKYIDRETSHVSFIANQNRDIFSIFRYRKRYLDLKEEKKEVEKKLTSQLETTLNNISDGFVSLDNNWCYTFVNTVAAEFAGRTRESLIGKHIWTEFPEAVNKSFYHAFHKAKETQETLYFEDYYEPLEKWVENRIYPSSEGLSIYFTDITEKRKTKLALKESEKYLENIINNIGDPVFVKDANSTFLIANTAFYNLFNRTKEEIIGKAFADDVPQEQRERYLSVDKKVIAEGVENIDEGSIHTKDGELRYISTKKTRYIDKKGKKYLIGTIRDITKLKNAERILKENRDYLDNIINNIGDPLFVKDDQSRLIIVNEAFCKIFNLSKEDIMSKTLAEEVPEAEQELFLKVDREVIATGVENVNEETLTVRGGETKYISTKKTRFIDSSGNKYLIGIIRDITERKKAEKKLIESESNLRQSQTVANIGSYVLNIKENTWESTAVLDNILGIDDSFERSIESWIEIVHPEEKEELQKYFAINVLKNHEKFDKEYRILRADNNKEVWVHGFGELEFDEEGNPIKMVGTTQDITQRKRVEIEIEQHKNNLEALVEIRTEELNLKNNELQRMNKLFVGRELKMKELKDKIKELESKNDR